MNSMPRLDIFKKFNLLVTQVGYGGLWAVLAPGDAAFEDAELPIS